MSDAPAYLAQRMASVKPSPIMEIVKMAATLRAKGENIIDLSIGEPDFDTPDHIKLAASEAMSAGMTKYTPVNGVSDLIDAIINKFHKENSLEYSNDEIAVTGGAKQAIFNALLATLGEGDEVIIPAPYWPSYPEVVAFSGGTSVIVPTRLEDRFRMTADQLESAITDKTKWVLLNYPSNPTGACYGADDLQALIDVLVQYPGILVMSDEIYEHLQYGSKFISIASLAPKHMRERVLIINGVSKAYAMTGWRVGYAAGPAPLIKAMSAIQGHSSTHASSISQAATIAALNGPQSMVYERRRQFAERCAVFCDKINIIEGFDCDKPDGAFYLYPSCTGLIGKKRICGEMLKDDKDVARFILEDAGVCCVPGSAFGLSPFLRFSFANSEENLAIAAEKIDTACGQLS